MTKTSSSSRFDWSAPRFLPLTIEVEDDYVVLSAEGKTARLEGKLFRLDSDHELKTSWQVQTNQSTTGDFQILSLEVEATRETLLKEVLWFAGEWDKNCERFISSTNIVDNVLFLRVGDISFFLSLDFPYSKISNAGISYPPYQFLQAGERSQCHTISVGACRLSGIRVGDLDRAEIEAVSDYIERRYPQRFDRPMFVSACITNRLTEASAERVFYSMQDNPTLFLNPDLLEEDLRLMSQIGVEYFQLFEGYFDWPDEEKTGAALRRLIDLGQSLGVRLGDYTIAQGPYCEHYNYERRKIERNDWLIRHADGTTGLFCLGCEEYFEWFKEKIVEHNRKFQEEMICLDFLAIAPCYAENHNHPVGDVYQQVRALVKLCHDLANLSPNFLIWPNAGNWIEFMPKLTWFTPNVYLTDPHLREYSPSLSFHKLLGDTRREQMVSVHDRYFVPWRNYTNCEYYAFPASRLHDHRVFEYSFLQGLAVTPNICPAETRTFLNRVPAVLHPKFIAFMRKWMSFIAENFDVWKHTARIGDAPGSGSVEIYSHILEDHGFICLVNQNSFPTTARFHLDGTSGLSKGEKFEIEDVYPQSCRAAEQPLPFAAWGDEINCEIQPYSVRFLKIKPFVVSDEIKVGGLPSKITETETGYRLTLRAPQGKGVLLSVALPDGQELESVSSRQTPTVPMYEFPVKAAQVIEQKQNYAFIQVNFPREEAPRSLTHWSVSDLNKQASDAVEVELPQLSQCNFLGGLVHGAFIEELEVQLDLQIKSVFAPSDDLASRIHPPQSKSEIPSATYPKATHQRFSTELHLPFIEKQIYGVQPDSSDDAILELAFSNPASVKNIRAFYNGDPIEVRRYIYSKRPEKDWYSFYIDLTGQVEMGSVKLDVDIEWSDKISVLTE